MISWMLGSKHDSTHETQDPTGICLAERVWVWFLSLENLQSAFNLLKLACPNGAQAVLQDIMWSSGHWPSPSKSLHPTCLMCGRLVCGPHKQMVQQVLSDRPLQSLADGERCLKLNPERLCRRISDPWMLESVQISLCCPWEACETEALVMMVKKVGYLGWDAVKEHLEERGIIRTSDQCQHHWREIYQTEANQESSLRTLVNRSLGDRWRKRDESIAAEFEAVLSERDEGSDVAAVGVHELGGGLIMWAPLLACYLSPRQTLARPPASLLPEMIQEDFLIGLSAFFRTPLIDRTGVLNQDQLWVALDRANFQSLLVTCCQPAT